MGLAGALARGLDAQRGALFPWTPIAFGTGIGVYFAVPVEPDPRLWGVIAFLGVFMAVAIARLGMRAPLLIGAALILAGFTAAGMRTQWVAGAVLGFRYYGPVEGRIVSIDRSASDKPRLTLDRVRLEDVPTHRTPARVRISLHGIQGFVEPEPGLTVILTGHLSPPEGPVEPGGFDFQRQAWFDRLGAVGYTRLPVLALEPAAAGRAGLFINRARMAISASVQAALPGRAGAFAAAITTGDRAGMDEGTLEALRLSNLAHLLAISGLHMGMLTGFVFAAIRYGLALWPSAVLYWPIHKIAALGALAAGLVYLGLSGGSVATERAFIMVAVMLMAVLFDRRALTIRAVAMAALIVLALRPEVLLGPGFQMSFAATAALVAAFQALRHTRLWTWHPAARWAVALFVSSAVAGFATAPIAAAHFNRVPHFGLIANLLSVPVMGALVMPSAVLAAVLAPIGLWHLGLGLMRPGIEWILAVADRIAALDGTVSHVPSAPPPVLPLIALGAAFVIIWQGRGRWAGAAPVAIAVALWIGAARPDVLISADGGLVGVMTPVGRALSKPRGNGFAASNWLENDGDGVSQAEAHARPGFAGEKGAGDVLLADLRLFHATGKGAAERASEACRTWDVVVVNADTVEVTGPCLMLDRALLSETGPVALFVSESGKAPRMVTARKTTGVRPWNAGAPPAQ